MMLNVKSGMFGAMRKCAISGICMAVGDVELVV